MDKARRERARTCSYLLPDPGGEAIREAMDALDAKEAEVERLRDRDEEVDARWRRKEAIKAERDGAQAEVRRLRADARRAQDWLNRDEVKTGSEDEWGDRERLREQGEAFRVRSARSPSMFDRPDLDAIKARLFLHLLEKARKLSKSTGSWTTSPWPISSSSTSRW